MKSSRPLLLLISLLWVPQIAAQNAYTWVDEKGVIHFSDSPQSDKAKSIHLPDFEAQAPAPSFDSTQPIEKEAIDTALAEAAAIEEEKTETAAPPLHKSSNH